MTIDKRFINRQTQMLIYVKIYLILQNKWWEWEKIEILRMICQLALYYI